MFEFINLQFCKIIKLHFNFLKLTFKLVVMWRDAAMGNLKRMALTDFSVDYKCINQHPNPPPPPQRLKQRQKGIFNHNSTDLLWFEISYTSRSTTFHICIKGLMYFLPFYNNSLCPIYEKNIKGLILSCSISQGHKSYLR